MSPTETYTSQFEWMGLDNNPHDLQWLSNPPLNQRHTAIEIGSWAGTSALALSHAFHTVYCIDHWQGNPNDELGHATSPKQAFQTFCRNTNHLLYRKIIPCVGHSLTYAEIWPFQVDLIFIDADHSEEAVRKDILAWSKHIRPGGILACHDYGVYTLPQVKKVIDQLMPKRRIGGQCIAWNWVENVRA